MSVETITEGLFFVPFGGIELKLLYFETFPISSLLSIKCCISTVFNENKYYPLIIHHLSLLKVLGNRKQIQIG